MNKQQYAVYARNMLRNYLREVDRPGSSKRYCPMIASALRMVKKQAEEAANVG